MQIWFVMLLSWILINCRNHDPFSENIHFGDTHILQAHAQLYEA